MSKNTDYWLTRGHLFFLLLITDRLVMFMSVGYQFYLCCVYLNNFDLSIKLLFGLCVLLFW